ncbi:MAG: GFA family protein [Pseudooceanicola sp.]
MSDRSGACMCGAVTVKATGLDDTFSVCHCDMCRRWTGSAMLAVAVPAENVTWSGEAQIRTLQSSDWAERAWCGRCGSGLYYRITAEGPMHGHYSLPLGLLDDTDGMTMVSEIYIDHKPDCFAFAGDHPRLTRAETLEKFGIEDPDA